MKIIDLRSDTVTKPSPEMRQVMAAAEVGDDVYGEDPTVNALEQLAAELLGKEEALFAPSGTQTNLLALLSNCERGDEYIVGQTAHTYRYEAGGGAVLGSIQPQPIDFLPDGTLDLDKVASVVKPDNFHFARSRLLCIENTNNGLALPMAYFGEVKRCASTFNLRLHLDGARIFNAAIKSSVSVRQIAAPFDTVSVCLSKGLGAPVGSVLCGDRTTIGRARRWRKMLGGGMRQAGILAAAGIYALKNNVTRLQRDHDNACLLAEKLSDIKQLQIEYAPSQTNMVFVTLPKQDAAGVQGFLEKEGVMIPDGVRVRLVTHLDVDSADIESVASLFRAYFEH